MAFANIPTISLFENFGEKTIDKDSTYARESLGRCRSQVDASPRQHVGSIQTAPCEL